MREQLLLHNLVTQNVEKNAALFLKRGSPHAEAAALRWMRIVQGTLWDSLMDAAMKLKPLAVRERRVSTVTVLEDGPQGAQVILSVAPSRGDDHLLRTFPGGDYSAFLRQHRREFHNLERWHARDMFHLCLLWDDGGADVLLHHHFPLDITLQLIGLGVEAQRRGAPPPSLPPCLVPEELIDMVQFKRYLDEMLREDAMRYHATSQPQSDG